MTVQSLYDAVIAVLRDKFIAIQAYLKKKSNKYPHITPKSTKKRKTKNKISRRKEIIKIRAKIS